MLDGTALIFNPRRIKVTWSRQRANASKTKRMVKAQMRWFQVKKQVGFIDGHKGHQRLMTAQGSGHWTRQYGFNPRYTMSL